MSLGELFSFALVAILVITDPPGTAVLFAAMTPRDTPAERSAQARRAVTIAFVVLGIFGIAGEALLRLLGITLPALKVAGGILLFLTAADMVTAKNVLRGSDSEREAAIRTEEDISVFPLAIPLIAGPGAMTTMVLLKSDAGGNLVRQGAILVALGIAMALMLICLLLARRLARLFGDTGASVIGRVLGVLLAALAAQIALDGIRQSLGLA
jgi:multiple antibiotic resistance protein